jgi:DNA-binding MarR family transcriptional regulator
MVDDASADGAPWLDDDQAEAWLALVSILEVLPAALDSQLTHDADLTFFEFLVLVQLAEVPGHRLRLSDLATATHTSLPRLSRVVARLEADGLVVREADRADGRSRHARLSARGWQKLEAAAPGHVELVQRIFVAPLSRGQLGQLRGIGRRLMAELDPAHEVLRETRNATNGRPGLSRPPAPSTDD